MIDWNAETPLTALTHLDGRNAKKLSALRPYFSEFAWMRMRLKVMAAYLQTIAAVLFAKKLSPREEKKITSIIRTFSLRDAERVVSIEKTLNHDLKALEVYLISQIRGHRLERLARYVNLGIGSEDINSIALGLQLHTGREELLIPGIRTIAGMLRTFALNEMSTSMVARTHAQPANVTTFGKEVANSLSRLCDETEIFQSLPIHAKCSGEVGTYQAYMGVSRLVDWMSLTNRFIRSFGLTASRTTTQIAPYDGLVRYLQSMYRINAVLSDFCKNMWLYVLLRYLRVRKVDREVGSSGMPHKVNPIHFEGAEGGLEMANGIIETLVRKLQINRLQRDFSDSTMRRNLVLPIAYSLLSYQSIVEALKRIEVDRVALSADLDNHAEVWLETVKAYGDIHGISDMYDRLKEETLGRVLSRNELVSIIAKLPLADKEKKELLLLCDGKHNPYPAHIVERVVKEAERIFRLP